MRPVYPITAMGTALACCAVLAASAGADPYIVVLRDGAPASAPAETEALERERSGLSKRAPSFPAAAT